MTNTEQISKLIFRYIRKELSKKETAELEAWRKLSPKNETMFQEAIDPVKIQEDLKALEDSRLSRLEKSQSTQTVTKPKSAVRRIGFRILKIAATILVIAVVYIGVIVFRFLSAHNHPARDTEDQLAAVMDFSDLLDNTDFNRGILSGFASLKIQGESEGWLLGNVLDTSNLGKNVYFRLFTSKEDRLFLNYSDSTQIWLNTNSTIKYPAWQKIDSIHIFLTGEVYVHIPMGNKHVYEIKISPPADSTTPSAFRQAVADKTSRSMYMFSTGGDFYLHAYFGGAATTATLVRGSLCIDSAAGKYITPVLLQPGQQAVLDSGSLKIIKPEVVKDLSAWKKD